ncbi:hypothetical protein B0H10DRAFT_253035 [Mycena sp. CBHHK59/15]|nr:hypothetical protein B0H10DRAFT_253035 [Mycena sp. CBHHK59/15]
MQACKGTTHRSPLHIPLLYFPLLFACASRTSPILTLASNRHDEIAMFSAVPPTTHALPKNQRVRLMRSARKLGDLLGTTPLLVEPCEPIPVPPAPETDTDTNVTPPTSILDPTSTSGHARSITIASVLSLDTLALHPDLGELTPGPEAPALPAALVPAAAPAPARPTLLVRINTHPPQGARARSHSQAYGRPAYSTPPSPVSPTPEPNAAARRRKMARVTRTFGESVPQELVFPHRARAATRRRSSGRGARARKIRRRG